MNFKSVHADDTPNYAVHKTQNKKNAVQILKSPH